MMIERTLRDLGEDAIVTLLRERFTTRPGSVGIGDDAAVFMPPPGSMVFTTDTMVEGVDFDLAYTSGADLGWKAMAINVSDLAAMGAVPAHALVTMCMPAETPVSFMGSVIDGLAEASAEWNVELVGGDLSSARGIVIGVALLGSVDEPVLRSGASVGDAICVTGTLGGSAAGLAELRSDPRATGPLVNRHLRPTPRMREGVALGSVGATAMLDISDGLAIDLWRLLGASAVGCDIDPNLVPVDEHLAARSEALDAALFGGEDFELLFTIEDAKVAAATGVLADLGTRVTRIGTITTGARRIGGRDLDELKEAAWDHLRRP